jgi:hypothetical protein
MLRLFFTRRKRPAHNVTTPDTPSTRLNRLCRTLQTTFATTLSRYERRLNQVQRKFAFFLFCLLLGGLSSAWIIQGLFLQTKTGPTYLHQPMITVPSNGRVPDSLDLNLLREIHRHQQQHQIDSTKQ